MLLTIPEIILLTKTDLVSDKKVSVVLNGLSDIGKLVLPISIYDFGSVEDLKAHLSNIP